MEAKKNRIKEGMTLPNVDDLFSTEEQRQEEHVQKIREIPLSEIRDFENHPYKVRDDEAMQNLMESVMQRGVDTPVILRPLEEGGYEMVSGHRRKRASELAGKTTIPAIIEEMTRDEAIIRMVESNYQRDTILPSEKAFAFKMRLEAMKRQAGRPAKNSPQVAANFRSDDEVAKKANISGDTVRRYIRLTELAPPLLELVDEKKIPFSVAVEVSYLSPELQDGLLEAMEVHDCAPTLTQAQRLKEAAQNGKLNNDAIMLALSEEKPVENKLTLRGEKIDRFFPKGYTPKDKERYVINALEYYSKHLQRQKEANRDSR